MTNKAFHFQGAMGKATPPSMMRDGASTQGLNFLQNKAKGVSTSEVIFGSDNMLREHVTDNNPVTATVNNNGTTCLGLRALTCLILIKFIRNDTFILTISL